MKTLLNPIFLTGCLVWLLLFILKKTHPVPYLNGYIADAFAIPVIANLGLWFQRVFVYKNNGYVLKFGHVVFILIYVTLVFEIILPRYSNRYTADCLDAMLYIAGGVFFFRLMNKPLSPNGK